MIYNLKKMLIKDKGQSNQDGFASIVIAMILILILSLVTVGFAQLMRNNQTQALNKQISSQAYYAAESGINDAQDAINAAEQNSTFLSKTSCNSSVPKAYSSYFNSQVGKNASYTCLLINPAPKSVPYTISTSAPTVTELTGTTSPGNNTVPINTITIKWQAASGSSSGTAPTCSSDCFPQASQWKYTGVLRVALTPLSNLSRSNLINNTYTAFLYPSASGGSATYATSANSGKIIGGNCNSSSCSVTISGLSSANYILSMRAIYSPVQISVSANGASGSLQIENAAYMVDATGKSQNELKRIRAYIPAHNNYPVPSFALQTAGGICKQLEVYKSQVTSVCP